MSDFLDRLLGKDKSSYIMMDNFGGDKPTVPFFGTFDNPIWKQKKRDNVVVDVTEPEAGVPVISGFSIPTLPSYRDQEMGQIAERTAKSNQELDAIHNRYKKAQEDYASVVAGVPERNKPGLWRSILAGAVGGAIGYSDSRNLASTVPRAMQVGEAIMQGPYDRKVEDWGRKVKSQGEVVKSAQDELDTYGNIEGRRLSAEGRMEMAKTRAESDAFATEQKRQTALANELKYLTQYQGNAYLEDGLSPEAVSEHIAKGGRRVPSAAYPGKFILLPPLDDRKKLVTPIVVAGMNNTSKEGIAAGQNTSRETIATGRNKAAIDVAKIRANAAALSRAKGNGNWSTQQEEGIKKEFTSIKSKLLSDLLADTRFQTIEANINQGLPVTPEDRTYYYGRKTANDITSMQANNKAKQLIEQGRGLAPFEYGRVLRPRDGDTVVEDILKALPSNTAEQVKGELNDSAKLPLLTWHGITAMPGWMIRRITDDPTDPMVEIRKIK